MQITLPLQSEPRPFEIDTVAYESWIDEHGVKQERIYYPRCLDLNMPIFRKQAQG